MPGVDGDPEPTSFRAAIVVVVGLMIGLVAGTLVAWTLRGDSQPVSMFQNDQHGSVPLPETEEAAEAFMAAWERSRRAEHIVVSEWHRSTSAGAAVTETRVFAQRLPDRIRSGAHNRSGRVGNVVYTCDRLPITAEQLDAGDATPEVECRSNELDPEAAAELDPAAMVAEEVELMRRHVEGTYPLYRVSQEANCFHLRLGRLMLVPPYGYRTTYCFDEESGAVQSLKVERAEGTDTEELRWVTTEVTDDDLVAIIEGTFDPATR